VFTRTIAAAVARDNLTAILDDAELGRTTLILRHSRPSAAVVPAAELETYRLFRRVMREVGESLEVSRDPEIVAAVRASEDALKRGRIIWDDED
jgi:PHD/YefM family antitoxin component YafN of YafNO toxin-antitoxin module